MKKNLVIIYGGKSCEHDISIITALHCYNSININSYNKILVYLWNGKFYIGENLSNMNSYIKFKPEKFVQVTFIKQKMYQVKGKIKYIKDIDCALLCTHGGEGENGALQGYLEINEIPYTSSSIFASSLSMDKIKTKKMLEIYHYKTLPYLVINENNIDIEKIEKSLQFPLIVKPSKLGSSIGISKVNSDNELIKAIELALFYDKNILIEEYLENNIEINCAAFLKDNEIIVSMLERPISESDFLSYEEKYVQGNKYDIKKEFPANIDEKLAKKIKNTTKNIYKDFQYSGVIRVDFLVKDKNVFVNEINTIPGSLAFYLFSCQGISYSQIIETMIDEAIKEKKKEDMLITSFYSNILSNYKGGKNYYKIKNSYSK